MAGINPITPVAAQIKPQPAMTLADLLNIANAQQQYQQAQQINPLTVQKAIADVSTAETQAKSTQQKFAADQANGITSRLTSLINNQAIINAEQNPEKANKSDLSLMLDKYAKEQATALNIPPERAAELIAPYKAEVEANPGNLRSFLKEKLLTTLDQTSRATTLGGIGTSTAPQPQQAPQPAGNVPQQQTNLRLPYPVRSAAQPYIPEPTEAKDQAAGQDYRNNLVGRQATLATDRRNVEETIAQAQKIGSKLYFEKGGLAGDLERKIRGAIASEDYKMLAKDLANLQMSNLRTLGQGGNTVAGMDLTRVASGDETVPPETLIKIARRAQADMTNIDMQANGAEQFKNRYGDNNMNSFKQAWNANADSKIFEAMNIIRDVQDPLEKQKQLKELFPTPAKHQEFLTKYRNIKKLSETGSL